MKYQILFSGKNTKKYLYINLSATEFAYSGLSDNFLSGQMT